MATDAPTILATSGGYRDHDRLRFQFADLLHYAVDLSGASEVVPKVCNVGTASGGQRRRGTARAASSEERLEPRLLGPRAARTPGGSARSVTWQR